MSASLVPAWPGALHPFLVGDGALEESSSGVRLRIPPTGGRKYADAQLDDYHGLRRGAFPWRPPLQLSVRARTSCDVRDIGGTAGFGFWNDPFTLTGGTVLAAPRAVWFFGAAPPNDMVLVTDVPGRGWKAAVLDGGRLPSVVLAPAAAAAIALTKIPGLGAPIMRVARRAVNAAEALLDASMDDWHTYALEWHAAGTRFFVDGRKVLESNVSPRGPLGFVAWIDNQYAIVSESGIFKFGLVECAQARWLELDDLRVERLQDDLK
ncbi:MAG: hypothetical protein ACE5FI_00395 [Anaerolineales bacterium]